MKTPSLVEHLSVIKDFRQDWKIEHKLTDILLLTICAVICGAEGWDEIEDFGEAKQDFLRSYGDFEAGIPSADTIARVVGMINPKQFQRVFADWMQDCHTVSAGEVIAIDGKTLRGSYDKNRKKGAIHMISAFSAANGVVLGQIKTEEKSNEITAIPELLRLLNLHGCLVTIDAMGCQKKIALEIVNQSADYLLAVKGNQPKLADAARQHWFIETKLHWCLDVGMNEDACRIRRDMASENLAGIRHIAMNYLKSETSFKAGIKRKQKKAAMSESYLATVLVA